MPRITAAKMRGNHIVDDAWCAGCGLYANVHGEHRADCSRGHRGHLHNEPCTDRCDDRPLDDVPDTRGSPQP